VPNINKILVGIDGSEYSKRALHFSVDLSKKFGADLIAFTAFNIPDIYKAYNNKENINTISIDEEIQKSKNLLDSIAKSAKDHQINITTEFIDTKLTPDVAILEYSENNGVDHIVLGHRGRSIENLLIGNKANSVVSKSKCTVTVVK